MLIRTIGLSFLSCLLFSLKTPAVTENANDIIPKFEKQLEIITMIAPTVERTDQARLFVIRNSISFVIQDMNANIVAGKPLTTFQTLRLIQNLIIQYRFSQTFLGWTRPISLISIYSPSIEKELTELETLSREIETNFGFDDSPYTQITANTFRQMQKLLKQIEDLPIDSNLKTQLRALWLPVGETIAIAEQGDRPRAFEKAGPIIIYLRSLYPYFDKISSSAAGFATILELQGLAEFYAEFAQMN